LYQTNSVNNLPLLPKMAINAAALRYYPALERVDQYVRAHLSERVSLQVVSSVAHLERKYFSAYFHQKVGVTFKEWLARLRVQRAIDAMCTRWDTIPRIGFNAGFKDVRSFERTFKKLTGTTPQAFRASVQPDSRLLSRKSRHSPRHYVQ
jgi:YesN/AraC family two-component response regulator